MNVSSECGSVLALPVVAQFQRWAAKNLGMKAVVLSLVLTGLCSTGAERQDPLKFSVRGDLERAKTYFSMVKHLDKKEFADADAVFMRAVCGQWGQVSNIKYALAFD